MSDLYFAPDALRRLPMALLRSQNYPKYPNQTAVAAQQVMDGRAQAQIHMPKSAVYTQWKSTYHSAFGANVVGMLAAMEHGMQQQAASLGAAPQTRTLRDAARPYNVLPGPSPTGVNHVVLSRDAQPQETELTVARLNDYVASSRTNAVLNRMAKTEQKSQAMQAITARQQYLHDRTIATRANTPWGLIQENS